MIIRCKIQVTINPLTYQIFQDKFVWCWTVSGSRSFCTANPSAPGTRLCARHTGGAQVGAWQIFLPKKLYKIDLGIFQDRVEIMDVHYIRGQGKNCSLSI